MRVLTCSVCVMVMESECGWGLGEGSNFQLEGPQNCILGQFCFRAFSSRRSSLMKTFVKTCILCEVAHLSIPMVWKSLHRSILP